MEAFNLPVEARVAVRALVAHVDTDGIWIPYSRWWQHRDRRA